MNKKLKILHINSSDEGGGAEDFALSMLNDSDINAKLIVGIKHTTSEKVFSFHQNYLDKTFLLCDKVLWKTGYKKPFKNIFSITECLNYTYSKLSHLKEYIEADIIHLHNIHGSYFDLKALENISNEKPIVWSLHDMWAMTGGEAFTFENENYKNGLGVTPYKKNHPLLNPIIDRRQHFLELKKHIYSKIAEKTVFVPGSHWLSDCLKSAFVWNNRMQINMIHESIDTTIFCNKGLRNWHTPRVLIINSNNPFKGCEVFKELFQKINGNFELYVIGETIAISKKNILVKQVPYLNNKANLIELFNNIDILVFPSKAENFALTTLMAMSCGVCVLASDIGGLSEQLQNRNGILFNPYNIEDISSKFDFAINNISQTREIGKTASNTVKQKYDIKEMMMKYKHLYFNLLK